MNDKTTEEQIRDYALEHIGDPSINNHLAYKFNKVVDAANFGYSLKVAELEAKNKALKKQVSELNKKLFNERINQL